MLQKRACGWCEHVQTLCEGSRNVSEKNSPSTYQNSAVRSVIGNQSETFGWYRVIRPEVCVEHTSGRFCFFSLFCASKKLRCHPRAQRRIWALSTPRWRVRFFTSFRMTVGGDRHFAPDTKGFFPRSRSEHITFCASKNIWCHPRAKRRIWALLTPYQE